MEEYWMSTQLRKKLPQAEASNLLQTITDAKQDKPAKSISFKYNDRFLIGSSFISRDKNMIIVVIEDHTEQTKAEEEKLALLMRHRAILGAVPDILMEVNKDLVYTWANEAGYA